MQETCLRLETVTPVIYPVINSVKVIIIQGRRDKQLGNVYMILEGILPDLHYVPCIGIVYPFAEWFPVYIHDGINIVTSIRISGKADLVAAESFRYIINKIPEYPVPE